MLFIYLSYLFFFNFYLFFLQIYEEQKTKYVYCGTITYMQDGETLDNNLFFEFYSYERHIFGEYKGFSIGFAERNSKFIRKKKHIHEKYKP